MSGADGSAEAVNGTTRAKWIAMCLHSNLMIPAPQRYAGFTVQRREAWRKGLPGNGRAVCPALLPGYPLASKFLSGKGEGLI